MRLPFRQTRVLALGLAMAAVPTAALVSGAPATTAAVVTAAPQIPDSPAGRQLSWFLDAVPRAPIPAAELEEHLNAEFLKAIPADDFNAFVKGLKGLTLEKLTTVQPTTLVGLASVGGHTYVLTIAVDGEGRINALRLDPGRRPSLRLRRAGPGSTPG